MSGHLSGLQKRVTDLEKRAIYVHCCAHNTNLVVQDAMENIDKIRNYLLIIKDLISFVKASPHRLASFETFQSNDDEKEITALRPFCPTRWCLRIISLKTLICNYDH